MKLREIERQYDRASRYYDALSSLVLGGLFRAEQYREHAVSLLGDLEGATVLDVGCGTGRNFELLVPRVGERGRVIGLDCSRGMLDIARRRVARKQWCNAQLICSDAATLDGVSGPVDSLIAVWCYGLVENLEYALARAIQVVRPGGTLSVMVFVASKPEKSFFRHLHPVYEYAMRHTTIGRDGDADDARLKERWRHGRAFLESRLNDFSEESYLFGTGAIFAGRRSSNG